MEVRSDIDRSPETFNISIVELEKNSELAALFKIDTAPRIMQFYENRSQKKWTPIAWNIKDILKECQPASLKKGFFVNTNRSLIDCFKSRAQLSGLPIPKEPMSFYISQLKIAFNVNDILAHLNKSLDKYPAVRFLILSSLCVVSYSALKSFVN